MKTLAILVGTLLALNSTGCTDDAFAGRLRRSGNFRGSPSKTAEPPNSLDGTYDDWLFWFDGSGFADPWIPNPASDTGISLVDTGEDSAVGGASTAGLTIVGGIGLKNEDKGVTFDGTECYLDAVTSGVDTFGPDLHVRTLFKYNGSANTILLAYRADVNNAFSIASTSVQGLRITVGNDVTYNCDAPGAQSAGTLYFIDFVYDADGGGTGKGKAEIFRNGTHTSCSETSATGTTFTAGGALTIGDDFDCGDKSLNNVFIGMGFRDDIAGVDETSHDADCVSLGLC